MKYEEKILTYLVENYRRSKKDLGNNKTNRRTQVKPDKIYKRYTSNDGDFREISQIDDTVLELSKKGMITYEVESFGMQIKNIYLVDEKILEIEQYLIEKYGYVSKDTQINTLHSLVDRYENTSLICQKECAVLAESIKNRKIPKNIDELDNIFKALSFIENNQESLYIREVSMKVYGDSKFFETQTLQPVCNILHKYSDQALEDKLLDEILLNYHISKEPQKLCIKGNVIINICGKAVDISGFSQGMEFHATDLPNIQSVKIMSQEFMTIENRTSYLRYHGDNVVTFYLGGYANRHQRDFIKLVYATNPDIIYKHFGDIDAGGFWIHTNLCEITGVKFGLFGMSINELKNSQYASCLHKLSNNDRNSLQELKKISMYTEVIDYMLVQDAKLEQEIISLSLMGKNFNL